MNTEQQNQIIIETEKKEPYKAIITSINMYEHRGDNYISYSDTDSQIDYFHSYTLNTKHLIEWLNKDNNDKGRKADKIRVSFVNEFSDKLLKRLKRICKNCNYDYKIIKEQKTSFDGMKWIDTYAMMEYKEKWNHY